MADYWVGNSGAIAVAAAVQIEIVVALQDWEIVNLVIHQKLNLFQLLIANPRMGSHSQKLTATTKSEKFGN